MSKEGGKGQGPGAKPKTKTALYMICVLRHSDEVLVASFSTSKDLDTEDVVEIVSEKVGKMTVGKRYSEPGDEGITVHFTLDGKGRIFAIMTKSDYPQRVAFSVLEELKEQFGGEFGSMVKGAKANSISKDAKHMFKQLVDKWADPAQTGDALTKVQAKLDQATDTMKENIQIAIKNTEMLENIEEQSEALEQKSKEFSKNANALRQKMWWKKMKAYAMIAGIISVILIIIIVPVVVSSQATNAAGKNAAQALSGPPPGPAPAPGPALPTQMPTFKPTKKN